MQKRPQSAHLNGIGGKGERKRGSAALRFQTTAGARRISRYVGEEPMLV